MSSIEKEYEFRETPQELLANEDLTENIFQKKISANMTTQKQLEQMLNVYFNSNGYLSTDQTHEIEVRFGTKNIKPINKTDYDNVIKKIKSLGFISLNEAGETSLKIQSEYINKSGKIEVSNNVRVEIQSLEEIQKYCRTNSLKDIYQNNPMIINFIKKVPRFIDNKKIFPVDFDDFNFRVSYQIEENLNLGIKKYIMNNWENNKKVFRYINRVTFKHPSYPVNIDISIVKTSKYNNVDKQLISTYNIEDSEVFKNKERIEIELEVVNKEVGPGTEFNTPNKLIVSLKKVIKFILSGLQSTNYPISYKEQNDVINEYMKLLYKESYNPNKITLQNFIGPQSVTLQITNISNNDENINTTEPNIRNNYVVTDKADGIRHLLFINKDGKIYLINTLMNIIFTGALTLNKDIFNTILDGELITNDKYGTYINLFAVFDIYYVNKQNVRAFPFIHKNINEIYQSRYMLMKNCIDKLNPISIMSINKTQQLNSPIIIENKSFYPSNYNEKDNIFEACNIILTKIDSGLYKYNTDGLIFTPSFIGVGSSKEGEAGPLKKMTWTKSFKWKPSKDNTIDFFVVTVKDENGSQDIVNTIYESGTKTSSINQLVEYKTIQLCCTYDKSRHGFVNPCQDVIDDNVPEYKNTDEVNSHTNNNMPMQFYPVEPYDPEAGLCNIMLKLDETGMKQMFTEENQTFIDNMIVEFSYDISKEKGWRWIPKRVRYDKTSEFLQGAKNYGNDYNVAISNWKSINNPITEDMIKSGENIPTVTVSQDIYYNKHDNTIQTKAMKNFHNLYVKKLLIKSVSKKNDILIDYACGKGGDLQKWISSQLSFVFGIDLSNDNLENRIDGACVRYLNSKKMYKNMPSALFVNGNTAYNIKSGVAMLNDKAKQITNAVFGTGPKNEKILGKGVFKQYGVAENGFNISSCQFALHYFFDTIDNLQGFMRNLAECTKLNGYFIGTCYDGKEIYNLLRNKNYGESIQIVNNGKKIWEVIKGFDKNVFEDNAGSIGYRIDVYQDSINQLIPEYLVNFDFLNRVLTNYGFELISDKEALEIGLPAPSGMFRLLFLNMIQDIERYKNNKSDYLDAPNMNDYEKNISFLNRYFVYKKVINVNVSKVVIDVSDIEINATELALNKKETEKAIVIAKETVKPHKPKLKKLPVKLLLEPATEAREEEEEKPIIKLIDKNISKIEKDEKVENVEKVEKAEKAEKAEKVEKTKKVVKKRTKKNLLIIED